MTHTVTSFGYDKGRPPQADLVIDVRHLPNPYRVPKLRPRTGRNPMVREWVLDQPGVREQIDAWTEQAEHVRSVAVGCSAGQHRSVAIAEVIAERLDVDVVHRELKDKPKTKDKPAVTREVHVITGPPCSGKTTHVAQHAQPGDLRVDYDHLANALTGAPDGNHQHDRKHTAVFKAVRQAAITAALASSSTVWIVHSSPSETDLERYAAMGAEVHTVDPGKATVLRRIATERPWQMKVVAEQWYAEHKPTDAPKRKGKGTTTSRGLGWKHQQRREYLLRAHRDGTPCWWCGEPMYRSQALDADHGEARVNGGTVATRLLHASCNRSRKDGSRDAQRPAVARSISQNQAKSSVFDWG